MSSLQFPVKSRPHVNRSVGNLWYNGKIILSSQPFYRLAQEKKDLICRGYARDKFNITY